MSVFYCDSCDQLVDGDEVLFIYDWKTDHWTCQNCLDADEDVDTELVWKLQGWFGRRARILIEQGICTNNNN